MTTFTRTMLTLTAALSLLAPAGLAQTSMSQTSATQTMPANEGMPAMNRALMKGSFKALHAPTAGTVELRKNAAGRWSLTVKNLKTEPAPDLHVWLHAGATVKDSPDLKKGRYVDLGTIKTTVNSRTYVLPSNVNPADFHSVVLWCDQFSVAFAAASLN